MMAGMQSKDERDEGSIDTIQRMKDAVARSKILVDETAKQIVEADKLVRRIAELKDRPATL
jgi:hypothetical protein